MGKLLSEERQEELFRERYLLTHGMYLKSIADMITDLYGQGSDESMCREMVSRLMKTPKQREREDIPTEEPQYRNLRNCWYHECSLRYSSGSDSERMRFAAWRILQSYYTVFSAVAAIVTCDKPEKKGHDATLNAFAREVLCRRSLKKYFIPPANVYLKQDGAFAEDTLQQIELTNDIRERIPHIIQCLRLALKSKRKPTVIAIPHYLKELRDWVQYDDAYLFIRLFDSSQKSDLDISLQRITSLFCVQTEFFFLRLFGWTAVNRQYGYFKQQLETKLGISPSHLTKRFDIYSENL